MSLPATRRQAWETYAAIQNDCLTGSKRFTWAEAERELGKADLFYLLVRLLRRPDINKDWLFERCREVQSSPDGYLDLWAREHYKDLACDTPVLTANRGWTTHGNLSEGDLIFAPDGSEVAVLAVTEHYTNSDCRLVTFSDGAWVVAGGGHIWRTRRKVRRRIVGGRQVEFDHEWHTTAEMAILPGRWDIGVCYPLQYPEIVLPIDSYILGVWLGDGHSNGTRITAGHDDADIMEAQLLECRIEVSRSRHPNAVNLRLGDGVRGNRISSGFANALRALGVMGDKHIPPIYLRGSVGQRMSLLQGLMDTDGHCNTRGTATFVQAKTRLAEDVNELAAGLGLNPHMRRYKNRAGQSYWQVSFQAHIDRNPFRMPRKASRAIAPSHYRGCRTVTSIIAIPSVPTNCIEVEGGMYCAGRAFLPTHNSTLITFGKTIQDILCDKEITIGLFSHTRPIAKGFLQQIKREFEDNEILKDRYKDVLWSNPEKEAPKWSEDGGLIVRREGNPKEATLEAHGLVDGQPTSKHFRGRVYDDVVACVMSPEMVQKTTDAWDLSQNLGAEGGWVRYIGTRYGLHDTYKTILERGAAVPRIHAATHNGRMDGKPVFLSEATWKNKLRHSSRAILASQQLQNPMADEAATFQTQWLRSYDVRPRTLNVYIMADPSRGRSATSDNTAMAVVGISSTGAKFLLDGACHRMTLSQRWMMLRTLYHRWARMPGVQHISVGYERYGQQSDDEYFQEQMELEHRRKVPNAFFVINELAWPREGGGSKRERVERLEPDLRNGRLFLPLPVLHDGRPKSWRVIVDSAAMNFGVVEFFEPTGLTQAQMQVMEGGSTDLLAKAIICRDPDVVAPRTGGGRYDLTVRVIKEIEEFPFGGHDDLIDSISRVYDMDSTPPLAPSQRQETVRTYVDGV